MFLDWLVWMRGCWEIQLNKRHLKPRVSQRALSIASAVVADVRAVLNGWLIETGSVHDSHIWTSLAAECDVCSHCQRLFRRTQTFNRLVAAREQFLSARIHLILSRCLVLHSLLSIEWQHSYALSRLIVATSHQVKSDYERSNSRVNETSCQVLIAFLVNAAVAQPILSD